MGPYTLKDRINYLISNYIHFKKFMSLFEQKKILRKIKKLNCLNKITELPLVFELDQDKKNIAIKPDEMTICYTCGDIEFSSPKEFLDHLDGKDHKFFAESDLESEKPLKTRVENWLETGIFHKIHYTNGEPESSVNFFNIFPKTEISESWYTLLQPINP